MNRLHSLSLNLIDWNTSPGIAVYVST